MQSKQSYVYDVFQTVASGYDKANARISLGRHVRWKRKAVQLLREKLPSAPRVLDLGCGTGDMLLLLSQEMPDAKLTGLDFSPNMLEQARERCASLPGLALVQGDAQDLPSSDDTYDGVSISFALRNTTDYRLVLSEAFRVLSHGGSFLCIDSFVPTNVLVKPFYYLYFSLVMPLLGGGVRNWRQYRWLSKSTKQFISARELCDLMSSVGYVNLLRKSYMFGACVCVRGDKA